MRLAPGIVPLTIVALWSGSARTQNQPAKDKDVQLNREALADVDALAWDSAKKKRTPKGWFRGRIPERVIYGRSVQFYFEGRNADGKPIVRNGDEQSPNVIVILKR